MNKANVEPIEIVIDGGPQLVLKGVYDTALGVVFKPKKINPGTDKQLSFQAILALVTATTIGQLRPHRLVAGCRAYAAYEKLLSDVLPAHEVLDALMFANIPVRLNKALPTDCIDAVGECSTGGIKRLGRLSGIKGAS